MSRARSGKTIDEPNLLKYGIRRYFIEDYARERRPREASMAWNAIARIIDASRRHIIRLKGHFLDPDEVANTHGAFDRQEELIPPEEVVLQVHCTFRTFFLEAIQDARACLYHLYSTQKNYAHIIEWVLSQIPPLQWMRGKKISEEDLICLEDFLNRRIGGPHCLLRGTKHRLLLRRAKDPELAQKLIIGDRAEGAFFSELQLMRMLRESVPPQRRTDAPFFDLLLIDQAQNPEVEIKLEGEKTIHISLRRLFAHYIELSHIFFRSKVILTAVIGEACSNLLRLIGEPVKVEPKLEVAPGEDDPICLKLPEEKLEAIVSNFLGRNTPNAITDPLGYRAVMDLIVEKETSDESNTT